MAARSRGALGEDGFRDETDSLGEVRVPADKLWGAQTQRWLEHSEIRSGLNSRTSQSWTVMVEAMNPELPPVDTWS